ncbi:hypothetical protein J6590_095643 [Homalodisca vitripennis]|nr:hypothetical protein J6590_095643 [Homalodisca vitripennis]
MDTMRSLQFFYLIGKSILFMDPSCPLTSSKNMRVQCSSAEYKNHISALTSGPDSKQFSVLNNATTEATLHRNSKPRTGRPDTAGFRYCIPLLVTYATN